MKTARRVRDLVLFDCAIDAKLGGCDLVKLKVSDVAPVAGVRPSLRSLDQRYRDALPWRLANFDP
jgi:hypothetical protein